MTEANEFSRRQILFLASAAALQCAWTRASAETPETIVFVCERGYAKSLVAALHFERLAQTGGLAFRALSRGIDPGAGVPAAIQAGLAADGFDVSSFVPSRPTPEELNGAALVVLIAVDADLSERSGPVIRWDTISPLSDNYDRARSEIVTLADGLLDRLAAAAKRAPFLHPKRRSCSIR